MAAGLELLPLGPLLGLVSQLWSRSQDCC